MKTLKLEIVFIHGTEMVATIFRTEWDNNMQERGPDGDLIFTDTEGFMYTVSTRNILYYRTKEA